MSLENKTGQELVPIELRAHHINGVLRASKKTIEEYASSMILGWYVLSKEDEFVDKTYSFIKTLVENPETRVKVVVGKKDFICDICR